MGRQTESGRYPSVDCYRYGGPEVPGPLCILSSEFAGPMLPGVWPLVAAMFTAATARKPTPFKGGRKTVFS